MTFCIRGEGNVIDVDAPDIDRALCGDCEKPLKWDSMRTADCCGFRYAHWTSMVSCHRVHISSIEDA